MFFRVEAKPVPDGPGDGPIVPLGPGRQTVGRKLGLPRQERQETVSPLLTRPPGDLGHPLERLQEGLRIIRLPHLWDVDVGHGSRSPGSLAASPGGEELPQDGPIGRQGLGQLCEHLALGLLELALPFRHLGQMPEHDSQR